MIGYFAICPGTAWLAAIVKVTLWNWREVHDEN